MGMRNIAVIRYFIFKNISLFWKQFFLLENTFISTYNKNMTQLLQSLLYILYLSNFWASVRDISTLHRLALTCVGSDRSHFFPCLWVVLRLWSCVVLPYVRVWFLVYYRVSELFVISGIQHKILLICAVKQVSFGVLGTNIRCFS
jgi:hypothetical protein